ncbi:MAG: hypothetical protein ABI625_00195 [bacterium]
MKKPTLASFTAPRLSFLVIASLLIAACSGDLTAPPAATQVPTDASKSLVGAVSGVYTFTVNPSVSTVLNFGQSNLALPASSICDLQTSGYGPTTWNNACTPATVPITITAVVWNAETDHPRVDFQPALRFNPKTNAMLTLVVSNAATLNSMAVLQYCNAMNVCVNESLTDATLATSVVSDVSGWKVSRRIKHFTGYMVAE